jgi:hypothetical protein
LAGGAVVGSNVQKRGAHECPWAGVAASVGNIQRKDRNVHWQVEMLLGATFKRGGTHECPWAGGAATAGNIQRKDMNVHWQIRLLLGATFKRGKEVGGKKEGRA